MKNWWARMPGRPYGHDSFPWHFLGDQPYGITQCGMKLKANHAVYKEAEHAGELDGRHCKLCGRLIKGLVTGV
jgi:hypothetical protein